MNLAKEKKTKIAVFYIIISQQYGTLQILNDPLSSLFQSILANILGFDRVQALRFPPYILRFFSGSRLYASRGF